MTVPTADLESIARASRTATILTAIGATIALASIGYSAFEVARLQRRAENLRVEAGKTAEQLVETQKMLTEANESKKALQEELDRLAARRESLLRFIGEFTKREQIHLIDEMVDWEATLRSIDTVPDGARKNAIYYLILLAWKDVPFGRGDARLGEGVDSPGLMNKVLRAVDAGISRVQGQRLSETMLQAFAKVDAPTPGDLLFYRGTGRQDYGHFVVMYLGPGSPEGHGVCVGAIESANHLQILDSRWLDQNQPPNVFKGYFRPQYRD